MEPSSLPMSNYTRDYYAKLEGLDRRLQAPETIFLLGLLSVVTNGPARFNDPNPNKASKCAMGLALGIKRTLQATCHDLTWR